MKKCKLFNGSIAQLLNENAELLNLKIAQLLNNYW